LNSGFLPKFNNKPTSIFVACPPSASQSGEAGGASSS